MLALEMSQAVTDWRDAVVVDRTSREKEGGWFAHKFVIKTFYVLCFLFCERVQNFQQIHKRHHFKHSIKYFSIIKITLTCTSGKLKPFGHSCSALSNCSSLSLIVHAP